MVRESVEAWSQRFNVPMERRNSIGMHLTLVRRPPETDGEEHVEYRTWFDANTPNPLGIRTSQQIFGEWTANSEVMFDTATHYVIVQQYVSNDGLQFDLSHQSIAPPAFRSSEISFRVVAEQQTLTTPANPLKP